MQFDIEWGSSWYINLKDEELVHDIQTRGHTDFFCSARPRIMKVRRLVGRVRWKLNSLARQAENVAFNISIKLFCHLSARSLRDRE